MIDESTGEKEEGFHTFSKEYPYATQFPSFTERTEALNKNLKLFISTILKAVWNEESSIQFIADLAILNEENGLFEQAKKYKNFKKVSERL